MLQKLKVFYRSLLVEVLLFLFKSVLCRILSDPLHHAIHTGFFKVLLFLHDILEPHLIDFAELISSRKSLSSLVESGRCFGSSPFVKRLSPSLFVLRLDDRDIRALSFVDADGVTWPVLIICRWHWSSSFETVELLLKQLPVRLLLSYLWYLFSYIFDRLHFLGNELVFGGFFFNKIQYRVAIFLFEYLHFFALSRHSYLFQALELLPSLKLKNAPVVFSSCDFTWSSSNYC